MNEPRISINGQPLTEGQAMTMRVALESFAADLLASDGGLGDDEHGKRMQKAYADRINEIRKLMLGS